MKKLTQTEAEEKIEKFCRNKKLIFLGWFDRYKGNTSRLILQNNEGTIWNTTTYNNLFKLRTSIVRYKSGKPKKDNSRIMSQEQAKQKLIDSGCPYDLSQFIYNGFHGKSIFICHEVDPLTGREHGPFEAIYCNILKNHRGCSRCSWKHQWTVTEWIERAIIIHGNKYDYSRVTEIPRRNKTGTMAKVPVICPVHGLFMANVEDHIKKRYGCPKCSEPKGEKVIRTYFREKQISFSDSEWIEYDDGKHKALPDFFLTEDRKGIIEFDGIQHTEYVPYFHRGGVQDLIDQIHRDQEVEEYAKRNNIPFLRIHYVDYDRIQEILDAWLGPDHLDIAIKITPVIPPDLK